MTGSYGPESESSYTSHVHFSLFQPRTIQNASSILESGQVQFEKGLLTNNKLNTKQEICADETGQY